MMHLTEWLAIVMLITLCRARPTTVVVPPYYRSGTTHYYTFWKAVSSRLMPKTDSLKTSVRELILDYCREQSDSTSSCLDTAKMIYDDTAFPSFPSNKTLQKENKSSQTTFIKSLLRETLIELYGYRRLLDKHFKTNCLDSKNNLTQSTCAHLKRTSTNIKALADDLKKQVHGYFNSSFKKVPKRSVVERTLGKYRRSKIKRSFALMYALYSHLHETHSALKFSLEFTRPGHS